MLVVDKNGGFDLDSSVNLDYDQWDRLTLKNLLSSYDSQVKEFYRCLDMLGDDHRDQDWVENMLEEANDIMTHLERVIEYYSVPDANYCKQIRDNYHANRRIAKMGVL